MAVSLLRINAIRLVGGMPVLDFLNTCNGRRPDTSLREVVDNLLSLEDVIHWFHHAGLIGADEMADYLLLVPNSTFQQPPAFHHIIAFRESLYLLLLPIAEGKRINEKSLEFLDRALIETSECRVLVSTGNAAVWGWRHATTLDEMTASLVGRLAIQTAELLTSSQLDRLKVCATLSCDWLFLDSSKNGRRRWCQMNICGSREKAKKASAAQDMPDSIYPARAQGLLAGRLS